ncbi:MAG: hypothetical protein ACRDNW_16460 [Trebonia sp.]
MTDTALSLACPVNGSGGWLPTAGEAKPISSVQVPGTGSDAYSDSFRCGDSTGTAPGLNPVVRSLEPYPAVSPSGATRYALTALAGSLASVTSTSRSRGAADLPPGTTMEYAVACPAPGTRPLPPVSVPLNVPAAPPAPDAGRS